MLGYILNLSKLLHLLTPQGAPPPMSEGHSPLLYLSGSSPFPLAFPNPFSVGCCNTVVCRWGVRCNCGARDVATLQLWCAFCRWCQCCCGALKHQAKGSEGEKRGSVLHGGLYLIWGNRLSKEFALCPFEGLLFDFCIFSFSYHGYYHETS